nr:hypothetical protein [Sulfitobacter aestuariivivens]
MVIGLIITAFSIPSILSAFSDRRAPRASAVTILIGGGLILFAMSRKPGGYSLQEIPDTFLRVVSHVIP